MNNMYYIGICEYNETKPQYILSAIRNTKHGHKYIFNDTMLNDKKNKYYKYFGSAQVICNSIGLQYSKYSKKYHVYVFYKNDDSEGILEESIMTKPQRQ